MIFAAASVLALWSYVLYSQLLSIIIQMVIRLLFPSSQLSAVKSPLKRYAAFQVVGSLVPLGTTGATSIVSFVSNVITGLYSFLVFAFLISTLFCTIYVLFEYHPDAFIQVIEYYNSPIAPMIYSVILTPLKIIDIFSRGVLGILNFLFWVFSQLFFKVFIKRTYDDWDLFQNFAISFADFLKSLTLSTYRFVDVASQSCDDKAGSSCFDVGPRTFDLIQPMFGIRNMTTNLLQFLGNVCGGGNPIFQIIFYLPTDINFAKGVHNVVNFILYTVIQLPIVTVKRCALGNGFGWSLATCLPDVEPPFNLLTSGLRFIGMALDNLLDVSSVIVQRAIGMEVPSCDSIAQPLSAMDYDRNVLTGEYGVAAIGLTHGLYAVTDGSNIQYFSHSRSYESAMVMNGWPFQIDVRHGIASVEYTNVGQDRDDLGESRTSMLGCRCSDNNGLPPMRIDCGIALREADAVKDMLQTRANASYASYLSFEVPFAQRTTSQYLSCREVEISVQSVRWPASRLTRSDDESNSFLRDACWDHDYCSKIDALIYVSPLCSSSDAMSKACLSIFQEASCYPFCMAARVRGSGADDLLLYNARDWRNKVMVVDRDCSGKEGDSSAVASIDSNVPSALIRTFDGFLLENTRWDVNYGCSRIEGAHSFIDAPPFEYDDPSLDESWRSVRLDAQPFSFSGDVVLSGLEDNSGNWFVKVERLYGDQFNQFKLIPLNSLFPASRPADNYTPEMIANHGTTELMPVPFAFSDMSGVRHPSTSSETSVFYVVNPSYAMFKGFASGCRTGGLVWKTQLSVLSSYAPIRIWRFDAFRFCSVRAGQGGVCNPASSTKYKDIPDAFTQKNGNGKQIFDLSSCNKTFAVSVDNLEYLNEYNVAVTVFYSTMASFNVDTGKRIDGQGYFRIQYLHPETMNLSDTPHQPNSFSNAVGQGILCPQMRRLPNIGSLATEIGVTFVDLFRGLLRIVLYVPALVRVWSSGDECPLFSAGHTLLQNCGKNVFMLNEFWNSVARVNAILWKSLSVISRELRAMNNKDDIAQKIDAVIYYGAASSLPAEIAAKSYWKSTRIPIDKLSDGVKTLMFPMLPSFATVAMPTNSMVMAEFSYNLLVGSIQDILPVAVNPAGDTVNANKIMNVLLDRLYMGRLAWRDGVVAQMKMGCLSFYYFFGGDNPWGNLFKKLCESMSEYSLGIYNLVIAMVIHVPISKCMCVDAISQGVAWTDFALENCYDVAPSHLRPFLLESIMKSSLAFDGGYQVCNQTVTLAVDKMATSLDDFFVTSISAMEELGPSLDYLTHFFDQDSAGQCYNFEGSSSTMVLTPEPFDYFGACANVPGCRLLCREEIQAFETVQKVSDAPISTLTEIRQESPFFNEMDEDTYQDLDVVAVLQLNDCTNVCGGSARQGDSCIAVAGFGSNGGDITVRKYCVPVAIQSSVRSESDEEWVVKGSSSFVFSVTGIWFADEQGDALLVKRNSENSEQFLGVYLRSPPIQVDDNDLQARSDLIVGFGTGSVYWHWGENKFVEIQSISEGFSAYSYSFFQVIAKTADKKTMETVLCGRFERDFLTATSFSGWQMEMSICSGMLAFFKLMETNQYVPVAFKKNLNGRGSFDAFAIPSSRSVSEAYHIRVECGPNLENCESIQKDVYRIPLDIALRSSNPFETGASISSRQTMESLGVSLSKKGKHLPVSSQNAEYSSEAEEIQFFIVNTGSLQGSHWLTSLSLFLDSASKELTQGAPKTSKGVTSSVSIDGSCNIMSCSGCSNTLLMNLCYAAKQCAVSRCISTVVNIEKPLCNLGTSVQSHLITWIMAAKGAWDIFHQSYGTSLRLKIDPEYRSLNAAWIDESFFSLICSAKDELGQFAALIPSIAGVIIDKTFRSEYYDNPDNGNLKRLDNRMSAKMTMFFAGMSSFFYQIMLLPLYPLIAMQRMAVCDVSGIVLVIEDIFNLDMQIGRRDLQDAASFAAGTCLTLSYEAGINENAKEELAYLASDTQYEFLRGTATFASVAGTVSTSTRIQYLKNLINERIRDVNNKYMKKIAQRVTSIGKLSAVKHMIDAALTYTMGVISGLQDFAQNMDEINCRVPKFNMQEVLECSCGDTKLRIPSYNAKDSRFWCKGTLMIHGPYGGFVVVHNPYTFSELASQVGSNLGSHLECISSGSNDCIPPWSALSIPVIYHASDSVDASSIPILAFQKCRENYQSKMWDEAAWTKNGEETGLYASYPDTVLNCLRDMKSRGMTNLQCLQEYSGIISESRETLFEYEEYTGSVDYPPDSCIVATGLANHPDQQVSSNYLPCMVDRVGAPQTTTCDSYSFESLDTDTCEFQPMLWSRDSNNKIPVASSHQVSTVNADQRALNMIESARNEVLCALKQAANWDNDNVNSYLFSGEGDALHQIFDCVVQGPYAKTSFYPSGVDDSLPVPSWARDPGGLGETRHMDLPCFADELNGDTQPPFTCGGDVRRRIIKYFVRDYINGGEDGGSQTNRLLKKLINASIARLEQTWNEPAGNLVCTREDDDSGACENFLPSKLLVEFDSIPGEHVVESVFDKLENYWKFVMTNNEPFFKHVTQPSDLDGFHWEKLGLAEFAADLHLYDSNHPVINYTVSEADYPFKNGKSLWDTCTGLLGQFMFTIPMGSVRSEENGMDQSTISTIQELVNEGIVFDPTMKTDFDDRQQFELPGLGMLERYVNRLLKHSFKKSSTFFSYVLRHVPSDSLVCSREKDISSINKILRWSDEGAYLNNEAELQPITLNGYSAFPLGGTASACMCSWPLDSGNNCLIPSHLCQAHNRSSDCKFQLHSPELSDMYDRILEYWLENGMTGYECPESDLSDSWGVVPGYLKDDKNNDITWIGVSSYVYSGSGSPSPSPATMRRNTNTNSGVNNNTPAGDYKGNINGALRNLLYYSQAGVRAGNLNTLRESSGKANVGPASRVHKLSSEYGDVSLKRCRNNILDTFDVNSVITDIVDDLFPVSQAVKEPMPTSTCLRYSIEYMRFNIMQAINNSGIRDTETHIQKQIAVVADWKLKCEMQLELLGMCSGNRVFEMIPEIPKTPSCPFQINDDATQYYVSAGCIVYKKSENAFHDPCRIPGLCERQDLTLNDLGSTTRLRFDVRFTGKSDVLGSWPIEFLSNDPDKNLLMQELARELHAEKMARKVPWRLNQTFAAQAVNNGKGVENTKGNSKWWDVEGFADTNTLFCDGISDYWPDDWSKPVGYHVTVPCKNASFKTFDSAFLVQYDKDHYIATMRYTSTALRDRLRSSSEYSKSGFCRRGVYGMPSFVTNTARMCTRDAKNVAYDATMPIHPKWDEGEYGDEYCSPSPYDTPWFMDKEEIVHPNMASMGYVALSPPGFYRGIGTADVNEIFYPSGFYTEEKVYAGVNVSDWGENCHNENLLRCDTVDDCRSIYSNDLALQEKLRCFRHTCILLEDGYCYEHADCESRNQMCSGEGRCEDAVWEVKNSVGDDIEFQVFTDTCQGSSGVEEHRFDTLGASVWQQIPDVLSMSGLCSHRNWFELRDFVNRNDGQDFALNTDRVWYNTASHESGSIQKTLKNQDKFRVHAHACDRDYQFFEGLKGCAPKNTANFHIYKTDNSVDSVDFADISQYVKMARTFYRDDEDSSDFNRITLTNRGINYNNQIMGFIHPEKNFLGQLQENDASKFKFCREIEQCHVDAYGITFNGKQVESRQVARNADGGDAGGCTRPATEDDRRECGIFGYKVQEGNCTIDYAFSPLQYVMCGARQDFIGQCGETVVNGICNNFDAINVLYSTSQNVNLRKTKLESIAKALNGAWDKLATAFSSQGMSKTQEYLYKMQCSDYVYNSLQKNITASSHCSFATSYHTKENRVSKALEQIPIAGAYYVSAHGLREFPFAWWVKCAMIHSKTLEEASESCYANSWVDRFSLKEATNLDMGVDNNIFKVNAGLTRRMYDEHKEHLKKQMKDDLSRYTVKNVLSSVLENNYMECTAETRYDPYRALASKVDVLTLIKYLHDTRGFYDKNSTDQRAIYKFESEMQLIASEVRKNTTLFDKNFQDYVTTYIRYVTDSAGPIKNLDFIDGGTGLSIQERRVAATHRFEFPQPTSEAFVTYTVNRFENENSKAFNVSNEVGLTPVNLDYFKEILQSPEANSCRDQPVELTTSHCDSMYTFIDTAIQELQDATIDNVGGTGYKYPGIDGTTLRNVNNQMKASCYKNVENKYICRSQDNKFKGVSPCQTVWGDVTMTNKFLNWAENATAFSTKYKECSFQEFTDKSYDSVIQDLASKQIYYEPTYRFCYRTILRTPIENFFQTGRWEVDEEKQIVVEGCPQIQYHMGIICKSGSQNDRKRILDKGELGRRIVHYIHDSVEENSDILKQVLSTRDMKQVDLATLGDVSSAFSSLTIPLDFFVLKNCDYNAQILLGDVPVCEVVGTPAPLVTGIGILDEGEQTYVGPPIWCNKVGYDCVIPRKLRVPSSFNSDVIESNRKRVVEMYTAAFQKYFLEEMWKFQLDNKEGIVGCLRGNDFTNHIFTRRDFIGDQQVMLQKYITGGGNGYNCKTMTSDAQISALGQATFKSNIFEGMGSLSNMVYGMQQEWNANAMKSNKVLAWLYAMWVLNVYGTVDSARKNFVKANMQEFNFHTDQSYENLESFQTLDVNGLKQYNEEVNRLIAENIYACNNNNSTTLLYQTCFVSANTGDSTYVEQNKFSRTYLAARDNFLAHSQVNGGIVVPSETTLYWSGLGYGHGLSTLLPSWSNHSREERMTFAKWIFNDVDICQKGRLRNSVCYYDTRNKVPVNPWVAGEFNPFVYCDSRKISPSDFTEVVDAYCNEEVCGTDYNQNGWKTNQTKLNYCMLNDGNKVNRPRVPYYISQFDPENYGAEIDIDRVNYEVYDNNLCAHQPIRPSSCKHTQGMIGGRTGFSIENAQPIHKSPQRALYHRVPRPSILSSRGLFLNGGNPLLTEALEENPELMHAMLKTHPFELGGHYMSLTVKHDELGLSTEPVMIVDKLPLTSNNTSHRQDFLHARTSKQVHGQQGWLRTLKYAIQVEKRRVDALYSQGTINTAKGDWSCPLRRLSFWSQTGNVDTFYPLIPDPMRAARMFNNLTVDGIEGISMNFNSRSHPTQLFNASSRLPSLMTSNGFCICIGSVDGCVKQGNAGDCTLLDTIQSLLTGDWKDVQVLRKSTQVPCKDQLDFPYEFGSMRDGVDKQNWKNKRDTQCDIADRLPKFQFRVLYNASVTKSETGETSLSKGGACHMGVAPTLATKMSSTEYNLCVKNNENVTHIIMECFEISTGANAKPKTYVANKTRASAPEWFVEDMKRKRQYCDACQPLPAWKYEAGANGELFDLPDGPEVSYGIPFRWSAARLLAADIKSVLCGSHHNESEACLGLIRQETWQDKNKFMLALTTNIQDLFTTALKNHDTTTNLLGETQKNFEADESKLWSSGWVACSQTEVKDQVCYGSISKQDWYGEHRVQKCHDTYFDQVRNGNVDDSAIGIDICNIDASMNNLCRAVQRGRQLIQEGNCLLQGKCRFPMFTYSPSLYSVNNRQFVKETVSDYYEFDYSLKNPGTKTSICDDYSTASKNAYVVGECASQQLETLQVLLKIARRVINTVIYITNVIVQIIFILLKCVVPNVDFQQITAELIYWFNKLVEVSLEMMKQVSEMIFKVLFNLGNMGKTMKTIINAMCQVINWLIQNIWNAFTCNFIKNTISPLIQSLVSAFQGIHTIVPIAPIQTVIDILASIKNTIDNLNCALQTIPCSINEDEFNFTQSNRLPVSSRCWVNYRDSIDERSPYSCTAQDTCSISSINYGVRSVGQAGEILDDTRRDVCDTCPLVDPAQFARYGCDTYTKQCTCGVSIVQTTPCTSTQQCNVGADVTCVLKNDALNADARHYGTMASCLDCTTGSTMCLRNGHDIGKCTCVIQDYRIQTCASAGDQNIIPSPYFMCGVVQNVITGYQMNWNDLALAPCKTLPFGTFQCVKTEYGNIAVSASLDTGEFGRRRLLLDLTGNSSQFSDYDDNGTSQNARQSNPADELRVYQTWEHVAEPCRSVMRKPLPNNASILDTLAAQNCLRWRNIGNRTIAALNITSMQDHCDHFLLSIMDFLAVISRRGVLYDMLVSKNFILEILSQSEVLTQVSQYVAHITVAMGYNSIAPPTTLTNIASQSLAEDWLAAQKTAMKLMHPASAFEQNILGEIKKRMQSLDEIKKQMEKIDPVENTHHEKEKYVNESRPRKNRKLLTLEDDIALFSTLSGAEGSYRNIPLPNRLADNWMEGPFSWPPHPQIRFQNNSCEILSETANIFLESGVVTRRFFETFQLYPVLNASNSLHDTMPSLYKNASNNITVTEYEYRDGDWAANLMIFFTNNVLGKYFGLTYENIQAFFNQDPDIDGKFITLKKIVKDMTSCSFESVMLCTRHTRSIGASLFWSYVLYWVLSTILNTFGIGAFNTPMWLMIPLVSMYLAYGLSPLCLPMVPTCLTQDIILSIQSWVPINIKWPLALQVYPHCIDTSVTYQNVSIPLQFKNISRGSSDCLKSCVQAPFDFVDWKSTLAYFICNIDPVHCPVIEIPFVPEFEFYTQKYSEILQQVDADTNSAYLFCFISTFAKILPALLALIAAAISLFAIIRVPFQLIGMLANCLVQLWCYIHVSDLDSGNDKKND